MLAHQSYFIFDNEWKVKVEPINISQKIRSIGLKSQESIKLINHQKYQIFQFLDQNSEMLTQSSSDNIRSLKDFNFNHTLQHQELVFRDSKFIFLDSSNRFPKISRIKPDRRYTGFNANHKKKISFPFQRPQTVDQKQAPSSIRRQTTNSQNLPYRKSNPTADMNLKFKCKNNSAIGKRAPSSQVHSSLTRNSKIFQNQHSTRSQLKRPNQVDRLHTKGSDQMGKSKRISSGKKLNLQSSRVALQNSQLKQAKMQEKSNSGQRQQKNKQQEKGKTILISHQEIRRFFGVHHELMKPLTDYLPSNQSTVAFNSNIRNEIQKNNEQEKLQKQLANINSKITQIATLANKNNSELKSERKKNCYIKQRAQIIYFLRNSQTKQIYSVLVGKELAKKQMRFSDEEFSHKTFLTLDDSDVHWVYIEPNPQVKLFPSENYESSIDKVEETRKWRSWQSDKFDLPFVSFLKCIFSKQPNLIKRIFQPPINHVYSIWLFLNGAFEPIHIDGYFPLDQQLNHFYGGSGEYLWLPILIKCICKVFNTFSRKVLMKIKNNQIYRLLTGLDLEILSQYNKESERPSLKQAITNEIQHGSTILNYDLQKKITYIVSLTRENELILVNSNLLSIQNLGNFEKSENATIFLVPPCVNYFVYTFNVDRQTLSKFELSCQRNIQVVFSVASFSFSTRESGPDKIKNIYIYEVQNYGKNLRKTKLVLKEEASLKSSHRSKLKRGSYKIFVEGGEKKIHLLFDGKRVVNWKDGCPGETYKLALLSSHEVKISQMETLELRQGRVEDSSNIYHNYDKK